MNVRVQYFAIVREMVNLRDELFNPSQGTTVLGLLELLVTRHTNLKDYIFDPKTKLPRPNLQFLIDDSLISNLKGFDTVLSRDCTFSIIPPVGGG